MTQDRTSMQCSYRDGSQSYNIQRYRTASSSHDNSRDSKHDHYDFSKSKLYKDLGPILMCMRIFGLYYKRVQIGTSVRTERHVIWCYAVCALMIFNVLRSLSVYTDSDAEWNHALNQKLLCTIWSAECAVKIIVLLIYSHKQNGLPEFFRKWVLICNDARLDVFAKCMMLKLIAISCMFIVFNSVVFTLILIYVPDLEQIFLEVSWRNAFDYENRSIFKVLLGCLALFNSSSSMLPMTFYVVILFAAGKELQKYNIKFSSTILEDGTFDGDVETYRLRHQTLCSLVHILDRIFSPMIAAIYSANIPMFCFVMYTLISSINLHKSLLLINLFWLTFILLHIGIVSVVAAWVNVQAHGPLESIYTIRSSNDTRDLQLQLTLFLSRLTGTQVGLTALRVFVVDRAAILTVVGMMITHFVLLVEFKQPGNDVSDVIPTCNCSVSDMFAILNNTAS